ncbi:MAG: urease accessory protein UreF [Betaproteobacteria bacterium]|nr:urease accessory protein UreF [Betaproteobacteria bacterium]
MEAAIEAGTVNDAGSAQRWMDDLLRFGMARLELPALRRLCLAWSDGDLEQVRRWNEFFVTTRETAELRAETLQMGYSLKLLLSALDEFAAEDLAALEGVPDCAFPCAFAFAVARWDIPLHNALVAYLWAWLENQVMAAIKTVPLGQTDGQRLLLRLGRGLPGIATACTELAEDELCNFAPGLAIASSRHETQYSRLFRS